jgi:hypothetical protein
MGRFARPSITGPPGGVDADLPSLRTALGLLYGLGGGLVGSWAMGALVQVTGISGLPKPEWIRWWYRHPLHVPLLHLTVCLALCYGFVAGRPWGRYAAVAYNSAWLAIYGLVAWNLFAREGFTISGPWLAIIAIMVLLIGASRWLLTEKVRWLLVAAPE